MVLEPSVTRLRSIGRRPGLCIAVAMVAMAAAGQSTVTLNSISYPLTGHPRVFLDGSSGTISTALQTSPRNTSSNPAWAAMQGATNTFISSSSIYPNIPGALNEALNTVAGTADRFGVCANAALLWWSQGGPNQNPIDPNGYLALAKYCIDHVEDYYADSFGCDTSQQYCGRASSEDGDYGGMRMHNIAITYTIARSLGIGTTNGLTSAEVTAFLNKVLNDRDTVHNGIDSSDCQTDGRGTQAMTLQGSITATVAAGSTSVIFSSPVTFAQGGVLLPSPPQVYQSAIGILASAVNSSAAGTLTLAAKYAWSGTFYYSPPLSGNPCGIIWVQRHSNTSPPIGNNPANYQTDYSFNAGITGGSSNLGHATLEGYIALALALADDDARAQTLLTQAYNYFLANSIAWDLSMYDGLNTSGPAYMWDRQSFVIPSVALMIQNSVVNGPVFLQNLVRNQARTTYYWRVPWASTSVQPPPWVSNVDFWQGYGLSTQSRGVTATYQWLLKNSQATEAAYVSKYMNENGQFTSFTLNGASYATFPFMFWDPASPATDYRSLPTQYHFTAIDSAFCSTLGVTCNQNYGWDHIVSKSDWTPSATVLTTHGGFLLNMDHTDVTNGGEYQIGRNVMLLGADAQYGVQGPPYHVVENANLISIGADSNYGVPQPQVYNDVATPVNTLAWAGGSNAFGDTSSRYAYVKYDISGAYTSAANVTKAQREVLHLKKSGAQDYIVGHDMVTLSAGQTIKAFWHYVNNGGSCPVVVTQYDAVNRLVASTQASSEIISEFLPTTTNGIALNRDAADFSYPGGGGYTCRVYTCPSLDGSTCNASSTSFEEIAVHMPVNATSGSMPTLSQLTASSFAVVQIADATTPKVAAFAQGGNTYTSVSFTSTHSGTAQYLIAGLTAGTYNVQLGSTMILSNQVVSAGDNTLYFESSSGPITIASTGSAPGVTLSCDLNGDGVVNVLDVQLIAAAVLTPSLCLPQYKLDGTTTCDVVDVQRVSAAALGMGCLVGSN